jgi:hypothetical protein
MSADVQVTDGNVVRPTIWQENADLAASKNRVEQADLVLDVAVKDAIALFRDGRPGRAHYRLARAQERAGRILGPTDWTTLAGGAR